MKNLLFVFFASLSLYSISQESKIYLSTSLDFVSHENNTGCVATINRAYEADGAFNTHLEVFYTISGSGTGEVDLVSGSAVIPIGKAYVEIPVNVIGGPIGGTDRDLTISITPNSNYEIAVDFGVSKGVRTIAVKDEMPLKAFPTAYGAGAYATGGRGGNVYHVTRLDDYGSGETPVEGTFRWAMVQPRPATIVFDVSGTIILERNLIENFNDLTIAGQTAPLGGITMTTNGGTGANNGYLSIEGRYMDNLIMRYMRIRHQITTLGGFSIYSVQSSSRNVIFDHLSFSWAGNSCFGFRGTFTENVTAQRCLFAESKVGALMSESQQHEYSHNFSTHNNVWYNISHRLPNNGANGRVDNINNFIHNWRFRLSFINGDNRYNHINNYHSSGSISTVSANLWGYGRKINQIISSNTAYPSSVTGGPDNYDATPYDYEIYTSGNIIDKGIHNLNDDNKLLWGEFDLGEQREYAPEYVFTDTQHTLLGAPIPIRTAEEINTEVRTNPNVGANASLNANGSVTIDWDYIDDEYLAVLAQGEGVYEDYTTSATAANRSHYYTSRYTNFVANLTTTPNTIRPDNFYNPDKSEHIPEAFYDLYMPDGASHNDIAPSGYTWLEEYLNSVDGETSIPVLINNLEVTPDVVPMLRVSETAQLTATAYAGAEDTDGTEVNQIGEWSSSDPDIASVDENGLVTAITTNTEAPYQATVTITFTIIDDNGQEFTDTSEITVFPEALQASAGDDQQICEGDSVILTASDGDSYLWSTGETTAEITVSPLSTTTYSVTVSDIYEQSEDASVVVTVNPIPVANAGDDQTICEGDTITLTASGGDEYLWNTGEPTATIEVSPDSETVYTVEVITNNCSSTDAITVFVTEAPNLIVSDDIVITEGSSTILTVSGGDNYLWSTDETTESITVSPTATTTYTVSSNNSNDCTTTESITVTVVPEVIADAGEDVEICSGESVTLNASGGIIYTWDSGDTGSEITVSPTVTTIYTVTVEDDYGFSDTDSVTIVVNETPNVSAGEDQYLMIGNSISLTATGGNTYSWDSGETTASITVSPNVTTLYTVTGFSENGCQSSDDILITVVEELNADAGEDVTICIGESTTLNASGGVSYDWNTGDTVASPTFSPTETTTYTVTIGDGFGNFDTDDVTIFVVPLPTAYAGEDQTICEGQSTVLTAEGGDSYLWSTGETTNSINVSPTNNTTFTVEVFSVNNCSQTDDITVFVNPSPDLIVSEDVVIMDGQSTTLTVSGSDNYLWSTGETSSSIEVSPTVTTTYTVSSEGVNGCDSEENITVTVTPEIIADAGEDMTICSGESVTLNASGGTTYTWNTGDTGSSPTYSPVVTTVYTVTVSDDLGNTDSDSVTVIVNEIPEINVSEDIVIIEGESATLFANGAQFYQWSNGEATNSITVSPTETTTYTVIGTTNGCSTNASEVTVTVEQLFVASAGEDERVCENDSYEIVLTANAGDSYQWSTGETTQSITVSPLSTSTYSVTVTYGVQEDIDEVTVFVDPNPNVTIANGDSVDIMNGDFVTLSASGANTYEWNNGATQPNIAVSPSETTTYEVRGYVGDCYDEKQVTVNVVPEVEANAGEDVEICVGEIATLTATGGDEYVWNTGETTATIQVSPTETKEYTVTVFNAVDFDEDSVIVVVESDCEDDTDPVAPVEGDPLDFDFSIFPNPTSDIINVRLAGSIALSRIYLYDITGKLLHSEIISNEFLSMSTTRQINVDHLETGMYYIRLVDINQDISRQFIVN